MRTSLFTTVFCRFLYGQKVVVGGRIIVWFLSLLKKMANSFLCNWRGALYSDKYPNYSTFDKLQTRKADFRWNSILLKSTGKNLVSWVLAKITHDIHICTQYANGYRLRVRIQANQTFDFIDGRKNSKFRWKYLDRFRSFCSEYIINIFLAMK